ncbi:TetR/AcrR family transcriptional regulator [Erythrobacter crassostreae]|uniref:TetR/AcrR family transcriptional regulator n=1 Tax=Erythrobacter crassostreae TaxID=2828328 RepID=A0A9X1JNY6_9SPHN|nr:TetR/AcrR family transcriptional regulator [Erythrobacter crassostrea]MBV7258877.1 TetR/AcrR family transcriptional regulator [Erythrobacter crassostrea]
MDFAALPTKGERTRAHIVATAANLFWRRSFHGVSVDLVADAAQVNKATIYRYFADKGDLALAVVRFNGAVTIETVFASSFDIYSSPQDRLAAIFRFVYGAHETMLEESGDIYGCPIVGLALELGQDMPEIRKEAQHIFDQVENYLTIIARDAVDNNGLNQSPEMLGRTLTQLLHGAFASARLAGAPSRILDAGNASLALLGFADTQIIQQERV